MPGLYANPRLILVEGPPGSGKSTTAQWIWLQMLRAGRPARWWYEGELPHPIATAPEPGESPEGFIERIVSRWAALDSDPMTIVEGWMYQAPIYFMLSNDVDPEAIAEMGARIAERILGHVPLLVHLRPPSVAQAYGRVLARGGPEMARFYVDRYEASKHASAHGASGIDGLVGFWEAHDALAAHLAEAWPGPRLDGDAEGCRRELLGRLELDELPPPDVDPSAFVGEYEYERSGAKQRFSATVEDGWLTLRGLPLLWPVNRLVPLGGARFAAEAWHHEVEFYETGMTIGDRACPRIPSP